MHPGRRDVSAALQARAGRRGRNRATRRMLSGDAFLDSPRVAHIGAGRFSFLGCAMCDETGIVMEKRQRVPRLPERQRLAASESIPGLSRSAGSVATEVIA
jgi:hypothetical protein